jgi:putative membrane protein
MIASKTNASKLIKHEREFIWSIYFLLGFGLLWQVLDLFEALRFYGSAPVMAYVNGLIVYGTYRTMHTSSQRFWMWSAAVFLVTFLVEYAGVHTGAVFGQYNYSERVAPLIDGVPLVIGLAWIGAILGAISASFVIIYGVHIHSHLGKALIVGVFVLLFDLALEPMAIALNYWNWGGNVVPIQNYMVWFGIGVIATYFGLKTHAIQIKRSSIAFHGFMAQIVYFFFASQIGS